ncbi:uncharacterized protein FIBRA_06397 [Fibroporia radiculosa]|uniref:Uncharacterized protein n=1 Tax=Fibroporia radiculosa TaxID=599839 RepID=J4GSN8_9APHY|nr:uncharacterized protein FIBRA_06397 [Fibroporia radiculosa]CCM04230.1 predicted protein [Fibroporia radiculosa]
MDSNSAAGNVINDATAPLILFPIFVDSPPAQLIPNLGSSSQRCPSLCSSVASVASLSPPQTPALSPTAKSLPKIAVSEEVLAGTGSAAIQEIVDPRLLSPISFRLSRGLRSVSVIQSPEHPELFADYESGVDPFGVSADSYFVDKIPHMKIMKGVDRSHLYDFSVYTSGTTTPGHGDETVDWYRISSMGGKDFYNLALIFLPHASSAKAPTREYASETMFCDASCDGPETHLSPSLKQGVPRDVQKGKSFIRSHSRQHPTHAFEAVKYPLIQSSSSPRATSPILSTRTPEIQEKRQSRQLEDIISLLDATGIITSEPPPDPHDASGSLKKQISAKGRESIMGRRESSCQSAEGDGFFKIPEADVFRHGDEEPQLKYAI